MDPRRLLNPIALSLGLSLAFSAGGCARVRSAALTSQTEIAPVPLGPDIPAVELVLSAAPDAALADPAPAARPYLEEIARDAATAPEPVGGLTGRATGQMTDPPRPPRGRPAIAAANRAARAASSGVGFVEGVQVFPWREGRVYEVWTAPLRVTALTLAPGETITAKAAGDTVRWQIGESRSGEGAQARTLVLIKPLRSGLETNLVLTTSRRVYYLALRSGGADSFNAAIAWDHADSPIDVAPPDAALEPPPPNVASAAAQPSLDARYRIDTGGRAPRWMPTAVFNDGARTFIALSPEAGVDEAPALFVKAGGELQLVNYRQADGLMIVDRVFDEAELRLGDRRPIVVRIRRHEGAAR
ncbi:TrbG/VirB9 family P-type conjugative transfer protein [Brevundimonas sp. PAMC22021]|uniref:TrbG/VirB9 family P-type conjugative transfer protein n=1 Tax=Brevundimonas sp. PAMC22021 TaxID=2861285 RepID=UPI001C63650E|nr:TrbG/VirB9 family P-type conjugative transfer protein [Brevundimonas sp. PAMC22021]QYF87045.1 TrbG/VirB9 family P-type conjugative transfer protein [Brevundimonas sp. PAMC22021]